MLSNIYRFGTRLAQVGAVLALGVAGNAALAATIPPTYFSSYQIQSITNPQESKAEDILNIRLYEQTNSERLFMSSTYIVPAEGGETIDGPAPPYTADEYPISAFLLGTQVFALEGQELTDHLVLMVSPGSGLLGADFDTFFESTVTEEEVIEALMGLGENPEETINSFVSLASTKGLFFALPAFPEEGGQAVEGTPFEVVRFSTGAFVTTGTATFVPPTTNPVPAPAVPALLGIGLVGLAWLRRRAPAHA